MHPRTLLLLSLSCLVLPSGFGQDKLGAPEIAAAMKRASEAFRAKASSHGGYVYYYSPDFTRRWGEGKATQDQVWVQRPGTPAVGMAFLEAYRATGDRFYLDAATAAAEALVFGQLESGGWTNSIDFDPAGQGLSRYRKGRGKGRNYSSFDDGISQHALRFLMHMDRALQFKHAAIHEASEYARTAFLSAQFPSGAFPQGWDRPVAPHPAKQASFPEYDWRTENRIKNYWDLPTLNDDLCGNMADVLEDAWTIHQDKRCRDALVKLGDFLLLAQLPEPQPAWAQQYDTEMRPVWARKFEPPAIASRESQDAIRTLLKVHRLTKDDKYLKPIPAALAYLQRSLLPDGRLSRYYELKSNRPLYMTRGYQLTHDDSDLPAHYGWKIDSEIAALQAELNAEPPKADPPSAKEVRAILDAMDESGFWPSSFDGRMLVGQPKFKPGEKYIASAVFCENLGKLAAYLAALKR